MVNYLWLKHAGVISCAMIILGQYGVIEAKVKQLCIQQYVRGIWFISVLFVFHNSVAHSVR